MICFIEKPGAKQRAGLFYGVVTGQYHHGNPAYPYFFIFVCLLYPFGTLNGKFRCPEPTSTFW